jgi:hypothetical protein
MSERTPLLANIGPRGRRRRLLWGLAGLAVGTGLEAVFVVRAAPAWWRLAVFAAFWLGALGVMQASGHT